MEARTLEHHKAVMIMRENENFSRVCNFLNANGFKSDWESYKHDIEYIPFSKDGCFCIDVSRDEIVLIDESGDFKHLPIDRNSVFTLAGFLCYNNMLENNFKLG